MAKCFYIGGPNPLLDYTILDCITSTSGQYIDTGFKPNQNTRVVIDIELPSQSVPKAILGGRNGDTAATGGITIWAIDASNLRSDYHTEVLPTGIIPVGRFLIDKNKNITTINDQVFTHSVFTFQSNYNLALFTQLDPSGPDTRYATMSLYSCKIYDNDTLIRDYIPVKNNQNEIGLYDKVNNKFYKNAGTGDFTAGNAISFSDNNGYARRIKRVYLGSGNTAITAKKAYIGINGIAHQFYKYIDGTSIGITYTGDYTDELVSMKDGNYRLLTLTSSGTLTLDEACEGDVWMCGGGCGGAGRNYRYGGGGGYVKQLTDTLISGSIVCTIGSGSTGQSNTEPSQAGATSFGNITTNGGNKASGGSGGGSGGRKTTNAGTGAGVSTIPFNDDIMFEPHSAGGGGGGYRDRDDDEEYGAGTGGSNGSSGGGPSSSGYSDNKAGGVKGGGNGAKSTSNFYSCDAYAATYYGSGGGGGSYYVKDGDDNHGSGASGYQGIIYVRFPTGIAEVTKSANEFNVGDIVFLTINGVKTRFIVVNQGNPDDTIYDSSCNGTWLMMEKAYSKQYWDYVFGWDADQISADYPTSTVQTYLTNTLLPLFSSDALSIIKEVTIPCATGNTNWIELGTCTVKIFLPSIIEVGAADYMSDGSQDSVDNSWSHLVKDGAKLAYFIEGESDNANAKRVCYHDISPTDWWTRSHSSYYNIISGDGGRYKFFVYASGGLHVTSSETDRGVRPIVIVDSTATLTGMAK